MKKQHTLWIMFIGILVVVSAYIFDVSILYHSIKNLSSSQEALQAYLENFGLWAPLVFFIIQIIQVIIVPIPGNIMALAGGAMFGTVMGFLLSAGGVITGSIMAFYLARLFGHPLVARMVGPNIYEKYNRVFSGKYTLVLLIVFLIPFFPDDALCFLAGLSTIPFSVFLILVVIGRMPGMLVASLVGSGFWDLTPVQWMIVGAFSLGLVGLVIKYKDSIEDYLCKKLKIQRNKH